MLALKNLWNLDPETIFLNHGSFGACPGAVLQKQFDLRERLENQPVRFMIREMEALIDESKNTLAAMMQANPDDMVFVTNATAAVNTVFRSLDFGPDDEILFTDHIYGACKRVLEYVSIRTGCKLAEIKVPFPTKSSGQIVDAILNGVNHRTRIALIDHITSPTALIFPVEELVKALHSRGVEVMIDGAHALGSVDLDLEKIQADYYTANCHKWLCGPKTSAILHVRLDKQEKIFPLVVSHAGYDAQPFSERFYWPGTIDPTPAICAGFAAGYLDSVITGGWHEIRNRNHQLCIEARKLIGERLNIPDACPDDMLASMATFILPPDKQQTTLFYRGNSSLQDKLYEEYHIEVPVWIWNEGQNRLIRISAQLYNSLDDFEKLGRALLKEL